MSLVLQHIRFPSVKGWACAVPAIVTPQKHLVRWDQVAGEWCHVLSALRTGRWLWRERRTKSKTSVRQRMECGRWFPFTSAGCVRRPDRCSLAAPSLSACHSHSANQTAGVTAYHLLKQRKRPLWVKNPPALWRPCLIHSLKQSVRRNSEVNAEAQAKPQWSWMDVFYFQWPHGSNS